MPIVEWVGYMRDGMRYVPGDLEVFECKKGEGMTLSATSMVFYGSRNRRVICDLNPCKKYKHFDEKEFLRESYRLGVL